MCGAANDAQQVLGKRLNQSQGKWPRKKKGVTTTVVQCKQCGLIYTSPLPIPENIADHYNLPPGDYWKEEYFRFEDDYFQGQIERFRDLYGKTERLTALDIGAGIGKGMTALIRAGFDAFGIEASETFYSAALERTKIPSSKLQLASIENADFNQSSFDFISFGAVLEHFYDPSMSLLKALKWLKLGGLIYIEVPSSQWLINRLANIFYRVTGTDYVGNLSPMHAPYHLYEFSLESFRRHASKNGYEISHHQYYVCQTFMPKPIAPALEWVMQNTNTGMQLEVWLKKNKQ
jgi:2-polyprenyl-3-methyl-5-hydroxy-6-metoxy-1,4-benzoquinol methylase